MQQQQETSTGWTEETRNQFHPGDIITALRLDYSIYSPHGSLGMAELVWHYSGYGRETVEVDEEGVLHHFSYVMNQTELIQADLRKQFPELADFADALEDEEVQWICSEKSYEILIADIEQKFGKTITVFPRNLLQEKIPESSAEKNIDLQKCNETKVPLSYQHTTVRIFLDGSSENIDSFLKNIRDNTNPPDKLPVRIYSYDSKLKFETRKIAHIEYEISYHPDISSDKSSHGYLKSVHTVINLDGAINKQLFSQECAFINYKADKISPVELLKSIELEVNRDKVALANSKVKLVCESFQNEHSNFYILPKEVVNNITNLYIKSEFKNNLTSFSFFISDKNRLNPDFQISEPSEIKNCL